VAKKSGLFHTCIFGYGQKVAKTRFYGQKSGQLAISKTPFWPERICEKWQKVVKKHIK
jgi:hypothetical protein